MISLLFFLLDAAMVVNAPRNVVKFVSLNGLTNVIGIIEGMSNVIRAIIHVNDLIFFSPVIEAVKRKYNAYIVKV